VIVASGFVETFDEDHTAPVADELRGRNIEVKGAENEKVVFLVERETVGQVKAALDSLKDIPGVRSVYLAYYSLEGGDADAAGLLPGSRKHPAP
jgi:nitrate reductase NapAB chaperone NapD